MRERPDRVAFSHATNRVLVMFTLGTMAKIGRDGYTCTARVDFYETRLVLAAEHEWQRFTRLPE